MSSVLCYPRVASCCCTKGLYSLPVGKWWAKAAFSVTLHMQILISWIKNKTVSCPLAVFYLETKDFLSWLLQAAQYSINKKKVMAVQDERSHMIETLCEGDIMFISVIKELCPGRSAQHASAIGKYKHMGWIDGGVGSLAKHVQLWKQRGRKKENC